MRSRHIQKCRDQICQNREIGLSEVISQLGAGWSLLLPPLPHPPTPPFPFIPTPSSSSTLCLMDCSWLVWKVEISVQHNMQDFGFVIGKFLATHQLSLNAGVQNICTPLNEIESDIFCILFSNLWESETSVMYFIVGYYGCVGLIVALGDAAAFQWESPPEICNWNPQILTQP